MLKNALFERMSVVLERLIPLSNRTIIIIIAKTARDAKAMAAVIKNDFKILWSFALCPTTIPKKIIERNIKNSTIINAMKSVNIKPTEKLPEIRLEIKNFIVSKNVGEMYIINIETIKQANPQSISINAVRYFELMSSFFVTGRVWVRYDSSL